MSYVKTEWIPKETVVTAERMNKIEVALEDATNTNRVIGVKINEIQSGMEEVNEILSYHETGIAQNAEEIKLKANREDYENLSNNVDSLDERLLAAESELSVTADAIATKVSRTELDEVSGRVTNTESSIIQLANSIRTKVSQSDFDELSGRVDSLKDLENFAGNLDEIERRVDQAEATVINLNTTVEQFADKIESKAEKTEIRAIENSLGETAEKVTDIESSITQLAGEISSKVSQSDLLIVTDRLGATESRLTQTESSVTQLSDSIASKVSKEEFDTLGNKVSDAESSIIQLSNSITTKVSQTDFDELSGRVDSLKDLENFSGNLDEIERRVDQAEATVANMGTTVEQLAGSITSKAEKTEVKKIENALGETAEKVTDMESSITQLAGEISSKVSQADLLVVTDRVGETESRLTQAESDITQQAGLISQKVSQTTYEAGLASKEGAIAKSTTAPISPIDGQFWLDTSNTPNVLKTHNGSTWVKATPTTADEVGAFSSSEGSALVGRVSTVESSVTQQAGLIAQKVSQTDFNVLDGRVSSAESSISQQSDLINMKVSKDNLASEIVQSPETIKLISDNIDLNGKVTADSIKSLNGLNVNDQFVIDSEGNVSFKGKLNGASGNFSGNITSSKKIGNDTRQTSVQNGSTEWYYYTPTAEAYGLAEISADKMLLKYRDYLPTGGSVDAQSYIELGKGVVNIEAIKKGESLTDYGNVNVRNLTAKGTATFPAGGTASFQGNTTFTNAGSVTFNGSTTMNGTTTIKAPVFSGEPKTSATETGFCGVASLVSIASGVSGGAAVNFRTKKNYTPSSVTLTSSSNNLKSGTTIKFTNVTEDGFWIYFENQDSNVFKYWRGTYTA